MIMGERHADTRSRIQDVALELFTEHGYEATSLREIAERLGVTKAALYYHFKTKDDIVASFMEDRVAALEEIVAWGQSRPMTTETRREIIHRYSDLPANSSHYRVIRFLERNQTALRRHPRRERLPDLMILVIDLLSDRGDPLPVPLATTFHTLATISARISSAIAQPLFSRALGRRTPYRGGWPVSRFGRAISIQPWGQDARLDRIRGLIRDVRPGGTPWPRSPGRRRRARRAQPTTASAPTAEPGWRSLRASANYSARYSWASASTTNSVSLARSRSRRPAGASSAPQHRATSALTSCSMPYSRRHGEHSSRCSRMRLRRSSSHSRSR